MSEAPKVTVSAFGLTDPGKVRTNNEDALLIAHLADAGADSGAPRAPTALATFEAAEHAVLLAVSDGVGGADAGEVASALVVESLRRAMREPGDRASSADWSDVTRHAVERANKEVWTAGRAPGRRGMGATVTAVSVVGVYAHIAEVGDSRAYLLRGARIRQITKDQSFVQYLIDAGALTPEEADTNPMKNVVLQAMGQNPDVQVALGRLELRRGDKLLLCSDGLSGKVKAEEMMAVVQQAGSLEKACRALVDLANERGGPDNITVVLASIDGEGLSPPRDKESVTQTLQVVQAYTGAGVKLGARDDLKDDEPSPAPPPAEVSPAAPAPAGRVFDVRLLVIATLAGLVVGALVLALQRL